MLLNSIKKVTFVCRTDFRLCRKSVRINNKYMTYRKIESELKRLLPYFKVFVVTGPRQSGKTTLCKNHFPSYTYFNLEDPRIREQIAVEPKQFLEQAKSGIIIDEAQQYPELLSYIQVVSDVHPDYRFVLTGSSNFALLHQITQSLAGRAALFTLLPFSIFEIKNYQLNDTDTLLFNGGFPAVLAEGTPVYDVCRNYYSTYIERDLRNIIKVKDLSKFQAFMRLCAGRVGSEFNASTLSNEVGVASSTIGEWLSVLEASYVAFRVPPFYKNIGKRLIKTPKIYFYDTAMVCYLLGIETKEQLATHPLRGDIFENMIVLEFIKERFNNAKDSNICFYRDKAQHEVDILQNIGDKYCAYEVKSARAFHTSFLDNLKYLKSIMGDTVIKTKIIYDGELDTNTDFNGVVNFRRLFLNPTV